MREFIYATGSTLRVDSFSSHGNIIFRADDLGKEAKDAGKNTDCINGWIERASACGENGGTVLIPEGTYPVYTIRMKSNVTLYLEKGAVLLAAKPTKERRYDEPEVNLYAGIQDHGHTYLANSLIYGEDLENVEIAGPGRLDGVENLERWDPEGSEDREKPGHKGIWNGNKGIALRRCKNVILREFSFLCGGHFALLLSACDNVLAENVIVDTQRDAFDIDGCQNVTVRGGWYNSPNDDALCLKADYGAGGFYPVRNVILEDTTVSGFDAGSVLNGTYTGNQMIAADRCRPTGRIKFGTEASCGCDTVHARRVRFLRSRGFCMESCDGAEMHDILMEDCYMEDVSSSPVFIRVGCRDRFPVTGFHKDGNMRQKKSVRLSEQEWVLPDTEKYEKHPVMRYAPCYDRTKVVETEEGTAFSVVNPSAPCKINPANVVEKDGRYYLLKWKEKEGYVPDFEREIPEKDLVLYANGIGAPKLASCWNIGIHRLRVKDADPRYPILLMGLSESRIQDIFFEDVEIEYRGGLSLQDAADQRQVGSRWAYKNYRGETEVQILPWMVNTFFTKNEALLPRYDWSAEQEKWNADPYNVPEMPHIYPEPSNWGILPAYGIYARHVENLNISGMKCSTILPDGRHFCVLDDVHGMQMKQVCCENGNAMERKLVEKELETGRTLHRESLSEVLLVRSDFRRPTGKEYVPEMEYHTECVTDWNICGELHVEEVIVPAPAPGTPPDSLYSNPTLAVKENGFSYAESKAQYPFSALTYRPYLVNRNSVKLVPGSEQNLTIQIRNPAESVTTFVGEDVSNAPDWLGNMPDFEPKHTEVTVTAALILDGEEVQQISVDRLDMDHFNLRINLPEREKRCGTGILKIIFDDGVKIEKEEIWLKVV